MANNIYSIICATNISPEGRQNLIQERIKNDVYKYVSGIIKNKNQKLMAINGMPDHVHILIGFSPDIALSVLVRDIKSSTTNYINEQKLLLVNSHGKADSELLPIANHK